ncbi:MAG: hypothetical protein MH472_12890 [Bacteroidia bacterium]|nr:hypothetical protein [Bacteroidia bacterium]
MHFSHDKHQYYFEKYLRNEMKGEELQLFEAKLQSDASLKKSFDFYLANRTEIVAEELAEYDEPEIMKKKPQRWGWLMASFSIIALVLIIDFYLTDSYEQQQNAKRKPFLETINVFRSEPKTESTDSQQKNQKNRENKKVIPEEYTQNEDSLLGVLDAQLNEFTNKGEMSIEGDYFVVDSLFKVLENAQLNERLRTLKTVTDSLLADSTLEDLARQSFFHNPHLITRQLLVEYWDSPIHIRGYLYTGKKLLVYGIDPEEEIYLTYSEKNKSYYLILHKQAFYLFPNNRFQKLAH